MESSVRPPPRRHALGGRFAMNGTNYVIVAYVIGLGLLWGYALTLWLVNSRPARPAEGGKS